MNDGSLNQLLQWSIENSATSDGNQNQNESIRNRTEGLNPDVLAQLLGAPSDADRMRQAMAAIQAPLDQVDLENKLTAWDNLEQLIEVIDNANNMESLGLWMPLLEQLNNEEAEMRRMAAWCLSTAVQNNVKSQERLLAIGGVPKLVKMATDDSSQAARKKAASALSSEVRNYQPALNELQKCMPTDMWPKRRDLDAGDMAQVDEIIEILRSHASRP